MIIFSYYQHKIFSNELVFIENSSWKLILSHKLIVRVKVAPNGGPRFSKGFHFALIISFTA